MKIVFAGQMAGGARVLRAVIAAGYEVSRVLVPDSEHKRVGNCAVVATSKNIPVGSGRILKESASASEFNDADILLNVLSPFEVDSAVILAPRVGTFNVHPAPLPRYAGLTPTSFAILRGEQEHGVTLHWMAPMMDAGDIVFQELFPILQADTPVTLLRSCFERAVPMVLELLATASVNPRGIPRKKQDLAKREYFSRADYPSMKLTGNESLEYLIALQRSTDYGPMKCPWGGTEEDRDLLRQRIIQKMASTG